MLPVGQLRFCSLSNLALGIVVGFVFPDHSTYRGNGQTRNIYERCYNFKKYRTIIQIALLVTQRPAHKGGGEVTFYS